MIQGNPAHNEGLLRRSRETEMVSFGQTLVEDTEYTEQTQGIGPKTCCERTAGMVSTSPGRNTHSIKISDGGCFSGIGRVLNRR